MASSRTPGNESRLARRTSHPRRKRRTVRVASTRREITRLTRRKLFLPGSSAPTAFVLHTIYSDGGERLEVHSLNGAFSSHLFGLPSEMNGWLRKLGYDV